MDVLISIRPKWVEKIFSGEKLVEIRKSVPKHMYPEDDWYIYKTGTGKVVGAFKVNGFTLVQARVDEDGERHLYNSVFLQTDMTDDELFEYVWSAKEREAYALHIKDLVKFVSGDQTVKFLHGWRREIFGNVALDLINEKIKLGIKENKVVLYE